MVPPTHGADLEDSEEAWAERLGFLLGRNVEAVVIQLIAPDDALAPALIELLLAQAPPRPLRVAFDVAGLYDAPEGARVVLVAPERSARALNLHRPVVTTRRMQLLLWCTPEGAFELKGTAPDMNSWVSHRLTLPPAWPPRVAEALLGAREQGEALTLLGPASPPPGFTTLQASLDPGPLADALDAGPVWLTGTQDALDVFTALAIWAERGKHGLVLHDPAVVVDAVPRLDAGPVPWTEATEACVALKDPATEPGVLAARLGLDPAALGLAGIERQRVENPDFRELLHLLRVGERPAAKAKAEALQLHQLAARWVSAPPAPPLPEDGAGRWVVLGPPRVAAPSQGGEAARRALPDGLLGDGLCAALQALAAEGPIDGLLVFGPLADPPGAPGQRVAARLLERARRALGLGVGEVVINSVEPSEDVGALGRWFGTRWAPQLSAQVLGGTTLALYTGSPPGSATEENHFRRAVPAPGGWRWGESTRLFTLQRTEEVETALVEAGRLAERGETDAAITLLRGEALSAARRSGHAAALVAVWSAIARIRLARGEVEDAERALKRAKRQADSTGDPMLRAGVWSHIAEQHEVLGQYDEAARVREEEELPLHIAANDRRSVTIVKSQIARSRARRGELTEAERILRDEVLPELERLGDERESAVTLGALAEIQVQRGAPQDAMHTLQDQAIPILQRIGARQEQAAIWSRLADIHQQRGDFQAWRDINHDRVIPVSIALNDELGLTRTVLKLAVDAARQGDPRGALDALKTMVLPTFQRLNLSRDVAVTLHHIAEICANLGDLGEALRVHREEALPILVALGDPNGIAAAKSAIAEVLMRQGALDEALVLLRQEVLPLFERLGNVRERAATLARLANVTMRRGELHEARRLIVDEVLPAFLALEDRPNHTRGLAQLAQISLGMGEYSEAERLLAAEVIPAFQALGNTHELAVMKAQRAHALTRLGRVEEAVALLRAEVLPVEDALHNQIDLVQGRLILADALVRRAAPGDRDEAIALLRGVVREAQTLKLSVEESQSRRLLAALTATARRPSPGVSARWAHTVGARHAQIQGMLRPTPHPVR